MDKIERRKLIEVALGKREATLKIENANLINVFSGEIYLANIYIYDEYIADVVECERDTMKPAEKIIDIKGKYLAPGFIDSHLHIESSHLTPYHFAEAVIPKGTTTIIADPHEIGNALGEKGVDYMLEASENLPMNQYFLIPSCVPSVVGLETTGAEFDADIIDKMLDKDRVLGLGEVMDFVGVINSDKRMEDIIDVAYQKDKFLQGHAPEVVGSELSAYLCGGPVSCHEVRDGVHAKEKIRKGMIVDARESSLSKNITSIVENIKGFKSENKALLIELPPYRIPSLKVILNSTWLRVFDYIKRAGTVILGIMMILWALTYFPNNGDSNSSYIAKFGHTFAPIMKPTGFGDRWETVAAIPPSIAAKEVVVGFLAQALPLADEEVVEEEVEETTFGEDLMEQVKGFGVAVKDSVVGMLSLDVEGLFTTPDAEEIEEEGRGIVQATANLWPNDDLAPLRAYSFMVFILLVVPCVATLGAIKHEFGWRYLGFVVSIMLVVPYIASTLVFQIGKLFF